MPIMMPFYCFSPPVISVSDESSTISHPNTNIISQTSTTSVSSYFTDDTPNSSEDSPIFIAPCTPPKVEYARMPFSRLPQTHRYCCVCGKKGNLIVVPMEARIDCFINTRIFILKGNRVCKEHVLKNRLNKNEFEKLRVVSHVSDVEVNELSHFLDKLCSMRPNTDILNQIDNFSMSEEKLKTFTGLTWPNLIELRAMMTSMRNSENRSVTEAIVVFLFKLRLGLSNNFIKAIMNLERDQQVSEYCDSALSCFERDVLPNHFGIDVYTREQLLEETSPVVNALHSFGGQLALICDGTYLRHQKV